MRAMRDAERPELACLVMPRNAIWGAGVRPRRAGEHKRGRGRSLRIWGASGAAKRALQGYTHKLAVAHVAAPSAKFIGPPSPPSHDEQQHALHSRQIAAHGRPRCWSWRQCVSICQGALRRAMLRSVACAIAEQRRGAMLQQQWRGSAAAKGRGARKKAGIGAGRDADSQHAAEPKQTGSLGGCAAGLARRGGTGGRDGACRGGSRRCRRRWARSVAKGDGCTDWSRPGAARCAIWGRTCGLTIRILPCRPAAHSLALCSRA